MAAELTRRSGPPIGLPGRAADELPAGNPGPSWGIPDHHQSEFSTDRFEVRAATSRGLMHRHSDTQRQDEYSVTWHEERDVLLVVVCDGVGQFADSQRVAEQICADLPELYSDTGSLATAIDRLNTSLLAQRAKGWVEGASTVVAAAITPAGGQLDIEWACVGDSSAWLLDPAANRWATVTPLRAEGTVHETTVRPLPDARLSRVPSGRTRAAGPLFLMSDGVSGPLSGSREVADTLAGWWGEAPQIFEFGAQVAFARKSHQDDRTVVGVWPVSGSARRAAPW